MNTKKRTTERNKGENIKYAIIDEVIAQTIRIVLSIHKCWRPVYRTRTRIPYANCRRKLQMKRQRMRKTDAKECERKRTIRNISCIHCLNKQNTICNASVPTTATAAAATVNSFAIVLVTIASQLSGKM